MKSRARQMLEKSINAIIAAIEVYNKPSFAYREESFSILDTNAWELLLKARILVQIQASINGSLSSRQANLLRRYLPQSQLDPVKTE